MPTARNGRNALAWGLVSADSTVAAPVVAACPASSPATAIVTKRL